MDEKLNIMMIDCCATCWYWVGWYDNMLCRYHELEIRPYWICRDFKTREVNEQGNRKSAEIEVTHDSDGAIVSTMRKMDDAG